MGIAASKFTSKSGSVSATTLSDNTTFTANSTLTSLSSASSLVSLSVASSSVVAVSSASSRVNQTTSVPSSFPSLSSIVAPTPPSSSISSTLISNSIQEIATPSPSLIRTEATVVSANGTFTSAPPSSQPITTSTTVISKASMTSSASSTNTPSSGSGDNSVPTTASSASTSSASSTATSAATSRSESPSTLSSSASSNPTSSSQESSPSSSGSSAGSSTQTTQAANGSSPTPSASSGQPQSTANGSQVAANSAAATGTQATAGSTSVEVVTSPSSTATSTVLVTGHPDSTLSTPRGITVSSNGHLSTTYPALITLVSTSTNANGAETTRTSIVANPTNQVSEDVADDHSFLHNEGAVAGVFTVVGIAFTAVVVAIFMICRRRHQRKARRHQWIDNIQKRLPATEDPLDNFENPREAPVMRSMGQISQNERYYSFQSPSPATARPFFDNGHLWDHDEEPPEGNNSLGLTLMEATRMGPFSDSLYPHQEQVGLAVTTGSPPPHQSRPSLVQSSPSIYPPSIPLPNDNASVYEDIDLMSQDDEPAPPTVTISNPYIYPNETVAGPPSPISPGEGPFDDLYSIKPLKPTPVSTNSGYPPPPVASPVPRASTAPLRPARSVLRETTSKTMDRTLVTPPPSLSGHGHENSDRDAESPSPSATSGLSSSEAAPPSAQTNEKQRPRSASKSIEDIVMRRTLLDVRPRSRDNVQISGRM
ncbi:hypothetical protein J3R30DRAFT_1453826 [Lentinula aciculospora]|uniref:Uncharacterized protein n=1 Tax=Lentinula aciculospora TaxID=153920 RepID=A0A9W9APS5_9AGAR|nr:hypothetical protein J3R30DRAFT_1453826 [Lentinula aciculospora]